MNKFTFSAHPTSASAEPIPIAPPLNLPPYISVPTDNHSSNESACLYTDSYTL